MKKILAFFVVMTFSMCLCFAQTGTTPQTSEKKSDPAKAQPAKAETKSEAAPLKKDGTPDMRYKKNKEAAKATETAPAGPLKKDGTPDKRYKENKEPAKDAATTPKKK